MENYTLRHTHMEDMLHTAANTEENKFQCVLPPVDSQCCFSDPASGLCSRPTSSPLLLPEISHEKRTNDQNEKQYKLIN